MELKVSPELLERLNAGKNVLTVGVFVEARGWNITIRTSGRMKTPEQIGFEAVSKNFELFEIDGNEIYLEDSLLRKSKIDFGIPGEGNFTIETNEDV